MRDFGMDPLNVLSPHDARLVYTPARIAVKMLSDIPAEALGNPEIRIIDPACKSGVYLREAAVVLMETLRQAIPSADDRRAHIFENCLFGLALDEVGARTARRTLYGAVDARSALSVHAMPTKAGNVHAYFQSANTTFDHLKSGDTEFIKKAIKRHVLSTKETEMQFDVIIGNPPYQESDGGHGASAIPLYHLFVESAIALKPRYVSMITPSRWFAGGRGLDDFRARMLSDKSLAKIVDFQDSTECFPGVEIKGGVSYFLWDSQHDSKCRVTSIHKGKQVASADRDLAEFDVFIRDPRAVAILSKIQAKGEATLDKKVSSQKPFGFRTNFTNFKQNEFDGSVKIYANKAEGWVPKDSVVVNENLIDRYKVLTTKGYNGGDNIPHQILGRPILAGKGSCCTETYIIVDSFGTKREAERFVAYFRTRFFRFLVSLRKNTQDVAKSRFAFVPDLPMDREWTDADLAKRYGLTADEVAYISSLIKEMN